MKSLKSWGACSFCLNKDLNHPNKVPIKDFTQYFTHVIPVYASGNLMSVCINQIFAQGFNEHNSFHHNWD